MVMAMNTKRFANTLGIIASMTLAACTPHTTGATQIGVKFNKVTKSLEEKEPGATHFFTPLINDWKTYDISTRSLSMTADLKGGDRKMKDDLRFKTRDGNDIETDVVVRWRIDRTKVPDIWARVGTSTDDIEERVVRPLSRSYVRDVLNRLDSEQFYNPDLRFAAANDATILLAAHLKPFGVLVEQVILGDFAFKDD